MWSPPRPARPPSPPRPRSRWRSSTAPAGPVRVPGRPQWRRCPARRTSAHSRPAPPRVGGSRSTAAAPTDPTLAAGTLPAAPGCGGPRGHLQIEQPQRAGSSKRRSSSEADVTSPQVLHRPALSRPHRCRPGPGAVCGRRLARRSGRTTVEAIQPVRGLRQPGPVPPLVEGDARPQGRLAVLAVGQKRLPVR